MTRHGDRAPILIFPTEDAAWNCDYDAVSASPLGGHALVEEVTNYKDFVGNNPYSQIMHIWDGNCTEGQLTTQGAVQHLNMGKKLREIYVNKTGLLRPVMNSTEMFIRSTEVWRAKQSAFNNMAGLYPPEFRTEDDSVVKMTVYPDKVETIKPNVGACPYSLTWFNQLIASDAHAAHMEEARDILEHAVSLIGNPGGNFMDSVQYFTDYLESRYCHGMPFPCSPDKTDCISDEEFARAVDYGDWEKYFYYGSNGMSRYVVGVFLGEILAQMKEHMQTGLPKYAFYSGHDDTISTLLGAFAFPDAKYWPPYASNFIFELYQSNGAWFVRILFNGKLQSIDECSDPEMCPFDEFYNIVDKNALIHDYKAECAVP